MIAPKFSVAVLPDSVVMSAEKRPGAPEVLVIGAVQVHGDRSLASTAAIIASTSLSIGSGRSTLVPFVHAISCRSTRDALVPLGRPAAERAGLLDQVHREAGSRGFPVPRSCR